MISLLIFTLAVFGLTFIAGQSKISLPFRTRLEPSNRTESAWMLFRSWFLMMLECNACFGFHLGWLAVGTGVAPHYFMGVWGGIVCSLYCCATSLILAHLAGLDAES